MILLDGETVGRRRNRHHGRRQRESRRASDRERTRGDCEGSRCSSRSLQEEEGRRLGRTRTLASAGLPAWRRFLTERPMMRLPRDVCDRDASRNGVRQWTHPQQNPPTAMSGYVGPAQRVWTSVLGLESSRTARALALARRGWSATSNMRRRWSRHRRSTKALLRHGFCRSAGPTRSISRTRTEMCPTVALSRPKRRGSRQD